MQDQWTLQYFLNVVEFGMDMQEAADAPTFHTFHFAGSFYPHEAGDGRVFIEEGFKTEVLYKLQDKGHSLYLQNAGCHGEVCAVRYNTGNGLLEGAASPKSEGNAYAMGW